MAEPFLGEIRSFSFGIIPSGWAACNGQLLQITQNQALYTILGTRFGGDGKTTFALPNLQGRAPFVASPTVAVGTAGGEESHILTINEMPNHTHQASAGADATASSPSGASWGTSSTISSYDAKSNTTMSANALATAGGSQAHSNMQPYLTINYCIAIQGIFPPKN
ncbi:phage tail protein [Cohnella zeiphila]|uniref:Phage tail protein n=1 Tax=Cohnella zeiphila TaxID=2761120 RepID=A0A7X0VY28_9BACL|nr:tail fiber protein [Cohnella zeiphila]MBB6734245.1 phage tail protein [Cohnella zeiphila]